MKTLLVDRMKWMRIVAMAIACLISSVTPAQAASVTLAWDRNPEPDIAGYRVYYGTASNNYTVTVDAGTLPTAYVSDLAPVTTYYIVVTAYNSVGLESLPSNEISFTTGSDPALDNDTDGLPDIWESVHGLSSTDNGSSSSINGPAGDPDADGISNLVEYAFDLDPQHPEATGLPSASITVNTEDGLEYLTVAFRKRTDDARLTYTIMSSNDCLAWSPASIEEASPPVPSGSGQTVLVSYRLIPGVAAGGVTKTFARVAITATTSTPEP